MRAVSHNPDFVAPDGGIKREWTRMRAEPRGLARPLLVLCGWRAPGFPGARLASHLRAMVGEPDAAKALAIPFTFIRRLEDGAARVIEEVDRRWSSPDPEHTSEVDVVGISMGGLIARAAAAGNERSRRLRIARLFTLGTPHRGAKIARWIRPDALVRDMRPGSAFLASLDKALATCQYELVCYTRLGDSWVGAANTAPPAHAPIWKCGPPLLSHQTVSADSLIRTDIARRLRGEQPLAVRGSTPPRD